MLGTAEQPTLRWEAGRMLRLAGPMMVAQGGLMTMGVVDTLVIGRVSSLHMAAVSLGNNVASVLLMSGLGLLMGLEPLVSQAHGAGQGPRAWLAHGVWLALFASPPLALLLLASTWLFVPVGVDPEIARITTLYVWARLPGVPFNMLYGACRSYLTSVERVRPAVVAAVIANLVNVVLDGVLVLVLDLGAVGVGIATSVCWGLMFLIVGWAAKSVGTKARLRLPAPDLDKMRRVLGLGWPIGLQLAVEVGIFGLIGVLVARFGAVPLAGHHIALTLASLPFMAGVGLAVAATTRVGMHVGAGHPERARRAGFLAIWMGAGTLAVTGLVFLLFSEPLARAFAPHDPEVVEVGAQLLRIAAVFAISDGIQVVSAGALRGAGDTRWPFYANAGAHWLVGFPVALFLGYRLRWGAEGFWWALSVGLTGVAVTLTIRFHLLSRGHVAPV